MDDKYYSIEGEPHGGDRCAAHSEATGVPGDMRSMALGWYAELWDRGAVITSSPLGATETYL